MFNRISIGIKAFLRDEKMYRCLNSIYDAIPNAHIILVDDGETNSFKNSYHEEMASQGHTIIQLPFDSGFGKKSNSIIDNLEREFLLIASDDFDFSAPDVATGIAKMQEVLDENPELSIVSGRLRNRGEYEFYLVEEDGVVIEHPIRPFLCQYYAGYVECDITFNYSLIRKEVFKKVRFDDEEIIGEGGHGAFFLDCKRAGIKVAYVPGVYIDEMPERDSDRYRQYRHRAHGPSRKCFEKRNIRKYILGDGRVDYERKDQ